MEINKVLSDYVLEFGGTKIDFSIDLSKHTASIYCENPSLDLVIYMEDVQNIRITMGKILEIINFVEKEFISHRNNTEKDEQL